MTIISNGSKWAGEKPDSVRELIRVLGIETLDPRFEDYGTFVYQTGEDQFRAHGNFITVSHVFNIEGTLAEMLPLARAIKANRRTPGYCRALGRLRKYRADA